MHKTENYGSIWKSELTIKNSSLWASIWALIEENWSNTLEVTIFDKSGIFGFSCLYFASILPIFGKPGRSPKNPNQIAPTYPPGYFERVFNIRSEIPRLWDILKEPNAHVASGQLKVALLRCLWWNSKMNETVNKWMKRYFVNKSTRLMKSSKS